MPDAVAALLTGGAAAGTRAVRGAGKLDELADAGQVGRRLPGELASGARRRPRDLLDLLDVEAQQKRASEAHDDFLKDDRDVDVISKHLENVQRPSGRVGFTREEIQAVKNHVTREEHPIEDWETGEAEMRKFDPDEEIADAWIRLRGGRALPEDLMLLERELAELKYLRRIRAPPIRRRTGRRTSNTTGNLACR